MTTKNQHPAQPPSYDALTVEWMVLDDTIQTWASFAHATRSAAGLCAVSAAFAALAAESAARATALDAASRHAASPVPVSVFADLGEARLRWLEVLGHLGRLRPEQDEEAAPLLPRAAALADFQQHSLQALALHLLPQPGADPQACQRIWIGTFPLPEQVEQDEEEAGR